MKFSFPRFLLALSVMGILALLPDAAYAMPGGGGGCGPSDNCGSAPSLNAGTTYSYDNTGCSADSDCISCYGGGGCPLCGCAPCGNEDCRTVVMGANCFLEGAFCGSPENTSWAEFCPTQSGDYDFTVSNISCTGGAGTLQYGIYSAGVSCGSNTQGDLLDCTNGTSSALTFTETLVAGQCYLIVFDGNAGATCTWDFTITAPPLPAKLSNLNAESQERDVRVDWVTSQEGNNQEFHLKRKYDDLSWNPGDSKDQQLNSLQSSFLTVVPAVVNGANGGTYSYSDLSATQPGIYIYELYQKDFDGTFRYLGATEAYIDLPSRSRLLNTLYTNESGKYIIEFVMHTPGMVELQAYDIGGKLVERIVSDRLPEGSHRLPLDLSTENSGVYFYELRINNQTFKGKLLKH